MFKQYCPRNGVKMLWSNTSADSVQQVEEMTILVYQTLVITLYHYKSAVHAHNLSASHNMVPTPDVSGPLATLILSTVVLFRRNHDGNQKIDKWNFLFYWLLVHAHGLSSEQKVSLPKQSRSGDDLR